MLRTTISFDGIIVGAHPVDERHHYIVPPHPKLVIFSRKVSTKQSELIAQHDESFTGNLLFTSMQKFNCVNKWEGMVQSSYLEILQSFSGALVLSVTLHVSVNYI